MSQRSFTLSVAAEVRAEMGRQGMTGLQLSAASGIPAATLYKRLAGKAAFNTDQLDAIAGALALTSRDLVARVPAPVAS